MSSGRTANARRSEGTLAGGRIRPLGNDGDLPGPAHRNLELPAEVLDPAVRDLNFLTHGVLLNVVPPESQGRRPGLVLEGRIGDLGSAAGGRHFTRSRDRGDRGSKRRIRVRTEGRNAWNSGEATRGRV